MLVLHLRSLPVDTRGTYTIKGVAGRMPARSLYLHPDAADAFAGIADWVTVSDVFRSPESSLNAVRTGRGAQPPGYSAHNVGLAIDLDLDASMTALANRDGILTRPSKAALDRELEAHGFYCHRRDHVLGHEAWHYNFLGVGASVAGALTSDEIEARILELYGHALYPDDAECQRLLAKLGMYHGEIDGDVGSLTREAVRAFERAWGLNVDGVLDARTRRTLAYVACERVVE